MFSDNDVQRPAKTSRMRVGNLLGGGVSIDCSHMLHLKRLGEAEDYPGLEDGLIIVRKTLTQLLDIASLTEDKMLWSDPTNPSLAVDIQGC